MDPNSPKSLQKRTGYQRQPYVNRPDSEGGWPTATAKKKWKKEESELRAAHIKEQDRLEAEAAAGLIPIKEESADTESSEIINRSPYGQQSTVDAVRNQFNTLDDSQKQNTDQIQGDVAIRESSDQSHANQNLPKAIPESQEPVSAPGGNEIPSSSTAPTAPVSQPRVFFRPANLNLKSKLDKKENDARSSSVTVPGHRPVWPHTPKAQNSSQLLTNHFELDTGKIAEFFLYPTTWLRSKKYSDLSTEELAGQAQDDDGAEDDSESNNGKPPAARKMRRLFALLLEQLPAMNGWSSGTVITSDYRREIAATQELVFKGALLPIDIDVDYYDEDRSSPSRNPIVHTFRISGPKTLSIGRLTQQLTNSLPTGQLPYSTADIHGMRDDIIRALNMFYGHFVNKKSVRLHNLREPTMALKGAQKFYPLAANGHPLRRLGNGLNSLYGYFRSVRYVPGSQFQLNLNTTISAFLEWSITVQQLIARRFFDDERLDPQIPNVSPRKWREIDSFLKGLRVRTTYKRDFRILTLTGLGGAEDSAGFARYTVAGRPGPSDLSFTVKDIDGNFTTTTQTVYEYFTRDHGQRLANNDIVIRCGDRDPNLIPARCLKVLPGQIWNQQEESLASSKESRSTPVANRDRILDEGLGSLELQPQGEMDSTFHMGLANNAQMLSLNAEKMRIPAIIYGDRKQVDPKPGWDLRNTKCVRPAIFRKPKPQPETSVQSMALEPSSKPPAIESVVDTNPLFSFIELTSPTQDLGGPEEWGTSDHDNFIKALQTALTNFGVGSFQAHHVPHGDGAWHKIRLPPNRAPEYPVLRDKLKEPKNIRFWIILIPSELKTVYGEIKELADLQLGIRTVFFIKKRLNEQTMSNLALKINLKSSKQAGNHRLAHPSSLLGAGTMVVGIDVAHAPKVSAQHTNAPSIAAVVASCDDDFCQWPASVKVNPRPEGLTDRPDRDKTAMEEVTKLGDMLRERLKYWQTCHAKPGREQPLPTRIIIYRDGLSEDQFNMSLDRELNQQIIPLLHRAYDFCKKPFPHIQLICAVKRHHTRFYPTSNADLNDKARFQPPSKGKSAEGNPVVGTVVYDTVTRGDGQDFFLISQKAMPGATLRPTHYVVLYNSESNVSIDQIAETTLQLCFLYGRATVPVGLATPVYYADRACDRGRKYFAAHFAPSGRYGVQTYNQAQHADIPLAPPEGSPMANTMYYI